VLACRAGCDETLRVIARARSVLAPICSYVTVRTGQGTKAVKWSKIIY